MLTCSLNNDQAVGTCSRVSVWCEELLDAQAKSCYGAVGAVMRSKRWMLELSVVGADEKNDEQHVASDA